jgi:hypothetical protein
MPAMPQPETSQGMTVDDVYRRLQSIMNTVGFAGGNDPVKAEKSTYLFGMIHSLKDEIGRSLKAKGIDPPLPPQAD